MTRFETHSLGPLPATDGGAVRFRPSSRAVLAFVAVLLMAASPLAAQSLNDLLSGAGELGGPANSHREPKATVTATLSLGEGVTTESASTGAEVVLGVRVQMPPGAYTYSQNPSFGGATRIVVSEVYGLEPLDDAFTPDHEPKIVFEEGFGQNVEKFTGEVTWTRRFRLGGTVPADQVSVSGEIKFQVCDAQSCTPLTESFEAFVETGQSAAPADAAHTDSPEAPAEPRAAFGYVVRPARPAPDPLTLQFELVPITAQPGETVTLAVTMALEDGWHTFGLTKHEQQVSNPTELLLSGTENLRPLGEGFVPVQPPELLKQDFDDITEYVHHGTVTWTRRFEVIEPGPYGVAGEIAYQICKTSCLPVKAVAFSLGTLQQPADTVAASPVSQSFVPVASDRSAAASQPVVDIQNLEFANRTKDASLSWILVMAFFGGLVLNVMPCVLPVLAIKVLSFIQQAGESRGRVLVLNVSYSVGVIGVFLVLAVLTMTLQLSLGGLFQRPAFNLVMTGLVFAMGLSLLGVFELPLPGTIGSAGGQHREGVLGAFLTGVFATLLATPCGGPLMAPAVGWSVKQPASVIFLVWSTVGLGMAFPYLMVGLFPNAIRFLPRPGMWMVRFKEFSGFALLATAVWLMSFFDPEVLIGMLTMLFALGVALWMVGALYNHASPPSRKRLVRGLALLVLLSVGGFGWSQYQAGTQLADARRAAASERLLANAAGTSQSESATTAGEAGHELPWEPFAGARLAELVREGKTVLIDFTADWCLICKLNEKVALNTEATARFVREHGIVPLYADFTREDPEIKEWLSKFDVISVPLTVIFPADDPQNPIVLDGPFTQATLLSHLHDAVGKKVALQDK